MTRHILVTGGAGQVGIELGRVDWPDDVVVHAPARDVLDLTSAASVSACFAATPFAAVVNAAAYTAVDKAEGEAGAAFAANALGPALLADATRAAGIPLVHVSTDYVFDGTRPGFYEESDPVAPLGVYGASKLAGELAVRAGNPRHLILRTAWVLSAHRGNFLKTMLRLAGSHPRLRVVADQIGCPTAAADIAATLRTVTLRLIEDEAAPVGTYHFVNAGEASWHGLAEAIVAGRVPVDAIATADYPTPARRPANSRLSTAKLARDYGIRPRPWQAAVAEIVAELEGGYPSRSP
ncbi:dTDP-4-dehydrorhamnose reductase [Sphingomonas quercus]|uniref:dTDP-4-dehydrorhamnose reductase n=1 Tax=Sphingomonas quercus TaxID=2842451 RepID=A0ABS6BG66_9SPHN|nr:dTDP-4-dehydrorhamnose reductase [Sphingomonas quercus]